MPDHPSNLQRALSVFPFLEAIAPHVKAEFTRYSEYLKLAAGQFICLEGDTCTHLALVLSGRARIYKIGQSGREITLYRINPGESCIMTASCILSQQNFPAIAVTETEVEVVSIPASRLQQWMTQDPAWQQFVFGLLSQRLITVMDVIEAVAFQRMDSRIAAYLLKAINRDTSQIHTTHEAIAQELGSSREVVSRILKDLETRGLLRLSRGAISDLQIAEMEGIAQS